MTEFELYQKKINDLNERIDGYQKQIMESKRDKIKALNDFIDYRGKYIEYDRKYIYVKTQYAHESIIDDDDILVLQGIGFDTMSILTTNVHFSFSSNFNVNCNFSEINNLKELTKEEFEEELHNQIERIKKYATSK